MAESTTPSARDAGTAASPLEPAQRDALQRWLRDRAAEASLPPGARIEVELGAADPRLRLARCARIEPHLPASSRPWGRTRVALRCSEGPVAWQISLPATVRMLAAAPVLREPLPAGSTITPAHLAQAEVDWADAREAPLADASALHGRRLARPLAAGAALRPADLQARRWFDAGARVRIDAVGAGWRVSGSGS
ncbi:MAG: flagellar basal body P-ring formation protein FlgA, partial [Burkholderiales bacterium]|nr:flagellar basal body P-ring formation protein FlgA [Burkholderiales bacterium]